MGLFNWIIENILVLMEIPISLLVGSLKYEEGWNHDWDGESVSFPMYYFEAFQFLLIIFFVLFILLLGVFIGYRMHKWRAKETNKE